MWGGVVDKGVTSGVAVHVVKWIFYVWMTLQVAMAMAAKAKLLLRELKTVKADFAFAKERCAQLEEENKILRENRQRGDNPEDDDLVPISFSYGINYNILSIKPRNKY